MAHSPSPADAAAHAGSVGLCLLASTLAGWRGTMVRRVARQPTKPLRLYEFEFCPHCRRVREALTELALDVEIRPCPKGGKRFRPEAVALGGVERFPFLVDEEAGVSLHQADDIIRHVATRYADAQVAEAMIRRWNPVSRIAGAPRLGHGRSARPSRAPVLPLRLTSFESSPYSRLVRERLCELELPYLLHNLGKEHWTELGPATRRITPNPYVPRDGGRRAEFHAAHGRVQVPYLEDPNTGFSGFESARLVRYLEDTYAL